MNEVNRGKKVLTLEHSKNYPSDAKVYNNLQMEYADDQTFLNPN